MVLLHPAQEKGTYPRQSATDVFSLQLLEWFNYWFTVHLVVIGNSMPCLEGMPYTYFILYDCWSQMCIPCFICTLHGMHPNNMTAPCWQTHHFTALAADGKFLLAARKCRRPTCTEYLISLDADDKSRGGGTYIGKLRWLSYSVLFFIHVKNDIFLVWISIAKFLAGGIELWKKKKWLRISWDFYCTQAKCFLIGLGFPKPVLFFKG